MKTSYLIAAVGAALLVIYLLQRFVFGVDALDWFKSTPVAPPTEIVAPVAPPPPTPIVVPPVAQPPQMATAVTPPEPPLPTLGESDSLLLQWATELEFPSLWLDQDQLVRRLTSLLDAAARGGYPKRQLEFLLPAESFTVIRQGPRTYLDTASYQRYSYLPEVLESVPVSSMAAYWQRVRPLVVQALGELGQREAPEALLQQVVAQLNAVPLIDQPIELSRPAVLYRFREDELEQRTDVEKLFLRMGPGNIRRLRRYANALLAVVTPAVPSVASESDDLQSVD